MVAPKKRAIRPSGYPALSDPGGTHAFSFATQNDFLTALDLLEDLSINEPIEYEPVGNGWRFAIVLANREFSKVQELFKKKGIKGREIKN